jgi:nucleoside-diphosphate-sugar epimerase
MVVGSGMMAQAFAGFAGRDDVLIFASGVSDSDEARAAAFERERELLARARREHSSTLLVYFGTCSVHDPDRRDTPYVRHKLAMEALLAASPSPWLILRVPLAVGPGHRGRTLAKFLDDAIRAGSEVEIWERSVRYPMDVADVVAIATRLIADPGTRNRIIEVAFDAYPVLDFVRVLERIAGKPARYRLVPKGGRYAIPVSPEVSRIAAQLGIDRGDAYLERLLGKYFGARP